MADQVLPEVTSEERAAGMTLDLTAHQQTSWAIACSLLVDLLNHSCWPGCTSFHAHADAAAHRAMQSVSALGAESLLGPCWAATCELLVANLRRSLQQAADCPSAVLVHNTADTAVASMTANTPAQPWQSAAGATGPVVGIDSLNQQRNMESQSEGSVRACQLIDACRLYMLPAITAVCNEHPWASQSALVPLLDVIAMSLEAGELYQTVSWALSCSGVCHRETFHSRALCQWLSWTGLMQPHRSDLRVA